MARATVGLGIEQSDKRRPLKQGQREVAEGSLGGRQVTLDGEVESKQTAHPLAVDEEGVERRKNAQTTRRRIGRAQAFKVGRANPVRGLRHPFHRHPDQTSLLFALAQDGVDAVDMLLAQIGDFVARHQAKGVERTIDVPRGVRLGRRRSGIGIRRQHALGQVKDLLEALASDHQVAGHEQVLQRAFGGFPVPPASGSPGGLEMPRHQRPFVAYPRQYVLGLGLVGAEPVMAVGADALLAWQRVAEIAPRQVSGGVRPVFEHRRAIEPVGPVAGNARRQDVVMGAFDDADRVDLDEADAVDDVGDGVRTAPRGSEETRPGGQRQTACLLQVQGRHGGQSSFRFMAPGRAAPRAGFRSRPASAADRRRAGPGRRA